MANRTYLYYQKKDRNWGEFEYAGIIPTLWQEIYSIELIEEQKHQIIDTFARNQNTNLTDEVCTGNLKVRKEAAIENLKSITNLNEHNDKKQLRTDFIAFIQSKVADNSFIELSFEEISWFYKQPQEIFFELHKFQVNRLFKTEHFKETNALQAIGYNEEFKDFSLLYQKLRNEQQVIREKRQEERRQEVHAVEKAEQKSNVLRLFAMTTIALALTFFAFFGISVKKDLISGIIMLFLACVCWLYVYTKYKSINN